MEVFEVLASSSIRLMVPLLLAMLGELISQRAGIMNVGLEGMMAAGAFTAYVFAVMGVGLPAAIVLAALAGVLVALLMAFGTVWMNGNAILVGFSLFILVPGVANFVYFQGGWTEATPPLLTIVIPYLSDLPLIGSALFAQNAFYYLAVFFTVLVWIVFARTRIGLTVSAVGHSSQAAETKGVSPRLVQTWALVACGALAALGGASLSLGAIGAYVPNIIGGRGFIVIAIVILGRWTVLGGVAGALMLAVLEALKLNLSQYADVPIQLLGALPWIVVILMLIVSTRLRSNAPRALV